jgi:uncharacterized protein YqeY
MALKDRLETEIREAMRRRDQPRVDALRFLKNALQMTEIERRKPLDDSGFLEVVAKQARERRESIRMFELGRRADLVAKESAELAILEEYLPAQMGQEELRKLVQTVISEVGATTPRDKGKVMGKLMPQTRGKADGAQVNALVDQLLASGG